MWADLSQRRERVLTVRGKKQHLLLKLPKGKKKKKRHEIWKKAASTDHLHLKNLYNILLGINYLLLPVPVDTVRITDWWIMRSANWTMSMLYKSPINSLCPVCGWHCNPSLGVWAGVLWAVEQWGRNPISVGSSGRPACERGGGGGRATDTAPGQCWLRPHSHTHCTR